MLSVKKKKNKKLFRMSKLNHCDSSCFSEALIPNLRERVIPQNTSLFIEEFCFWMPGSSNKSGRTLSGGWFSSTALAHSCQKSSWGLLPPDPHRSQAPGRAACLVSAVVPCTEGLEEESSLLHRVCWAGVQHSACRCQALQGGRTTQEFRCTKIGFCTRSCLSVSLLRSSMQL